MKLLQRSVLLTGLMLTLAAAGFCEYYRYTDERGVLRFTDDFSTVPASQRAGVQVKPSVTGDTDQSAPAQGQPAQHQLAHEETVAAPVVAPEGEWEKNVQQQIDEINRMNLDLRKTYTALQKERSRLEKKEPSQRAPEQEWEAYRSQVEALNKKIEGYEQRVAVYEERKKNLEQQFKR